MEIQHFPSVQQPLDQTKYLGVLSAVWELITYTVQAVLSSEYVEGWKKSLRERVNKCTVHNIYKKCINICLKLLVHNKSFKTFLQTQVQIQMCLNPREKLTFE